MKKQEPIRIAQIIGKWVGGGVEAVVMNYYRHIDKSKIQFDFICDEDSTNIPYDEIKKLGGNVILIPPYQKPFKYHKVLKKVLKEGKYKIVHSHINTLSVFSLWAAKNAKVPVRIAHSHSTSNKKEKKKNLLKKVLKPFSKLFATDYMACTEHAGRWLFGNKPYDKGKVYLLNNAIDIDKYKFNEDIRKKLRKELKINENTFVIGHIGRFVEQKNHRFLIDLFYEYQQKYKNTLLILVGQGPLLGEIKQKVENYKIQNKVLFLGQRDDVNELYQAFDMFILPSLYEGLGMVLIEAQCSGLPCLASSEVPKIAKIQEQFEFIDLDINKEKWLESINNLSLSLNNRKSYNTSQYDIIQESNKLTKQYLFLSNNNDLLVEKKDIAAVVVLYNFDEEIINNIKSYIDLVDKVILIDNSDDKKYYERIKNNNIIKKCNYISMDSNKGIAAALNVGIKFSFENNYKWVLTMDQDSEITNNTIDHYLSFLNQNNYTDIALLSPNYNFDRKRLKIYNGVKEKEYVMQSGNLLNISVFNNLGTFKEDFFIDGVDYEYCLRLKKNKYKIVEIGSAVLNHNPGITHKFLFFKYGYCSPLRIYYQTRNLLWISRKYKSIKMRLIVIYKYLKIILLFDNKNEFLKMFHQGKNDYKNNRFGKYKESI